MQQLNVIKIGGNVLDNREMLENFLQKLSASSQPVVLVHGGGKEASRLSAKLGIEPNMINGRRVTDRETLDIVTMVYAGLINKRVISLLQSYGRNAIGLTGADADSITATRRAPKPIDYGFVGDINPDEVNAEFITMLVNEGITPVFCAICHDGNGSLLNCNADSVASSIAVACSKILPTRLVYCFEKKGVLINPDDDESVVHRITPELYDQYKNSGIISGGMLPKIQNALNAVENGVESVLIGNPNAPFSSKGTLICCT